MKDFKVILIGVVAIITTLALNFRHALNDYGVLNNSLHVEVLAQSNNSGGFTFNGQGWSSQDNGMWNGNWYPTLTKCTHSEITGMPPFQVSVSYDGKMVKCTNGTGNCFNGTPCVPDENGGHT